MQGSESRPFPFYFSNYGENVHLGGFKDIVTGGLSNSKFAVGITFNIGNVDSYAKGVYRYATNGQQILIDDVCIKNNFNKFSVKWEGQNKGYSAFREISVKNKEKENKIASLIMSSFSGFLSNVTDEKADDEKLNKFLHDMTSSSDSWEK
ncbi:hypothetical protein [Shewanella algae]